MNQLVNQDHTFSLVPQNMTEAMEFAQMICVTDIVPKQMKGNSGMVLAAMMMGMEIGLSPLQGIQNIAVINGRCTLWGDAMIGLVRASGQLVKHKEWVDKETATGHCVVQRKGEEEKSYTFSWHDATVAGLSIKQGPWQQYPGRMMMLRARGFALRDNFADILKGLWIREEAMDITPVEPSAEAFENHSSTPQAIAHEPGETLSGMEALSSALTKEPEPVFVDADFVDEDINERLAAEDEVLFDPTIMDWQASVSGAADVQELAMLASQAAEVTDDQVREEVLRMIEVRQSVLSTTQR